VKVVHLFIVLVLVFVIFGCSSAPQQSPTNNGSEKNVKEPVKTFECPDGTIVTDISSCPRRTPNEINTSKDAVNNTVKVIGITDGDTLVIEGGKAVRLIGINAPETGAKYYEEASAKLKELVLQKNVVLEKDSTDTDRYGRLLRYVYVGDIFVNYELVRQGYANSYFYGDDVKHKVVIEAAEERAKSEKLGLWGESTYKNCFQVVDFHWNADGDDNNNLNGEYVTINNICQNSINMTGWTIKDEATNTYTFPTFILAGNSPFTLYSGSGTNTASKLYWNRAGYAVWNNDGDTLFLRDGFGGLILSQGYLGYS
jgi:micrococcal nuclease